MHRRIQSVAVSGHVEPSRMIFGRVEAVGQLTELAELAELTELTELTVSVKLARRLTMECLLLMTVRAR